MSTGRHLTFSKTWIFIIVLMAGTAFGQVNPGDNVTADLTLTGDLDASSYNGPAIRVGANNITIDGAGFTITVNGNNAGFELYNRSGVTIKNATVVSSVAGQGRGVNMSNANSATIKDNTFSGLYNALYVTGTSSNVLIDNNDLSGSSHFGMWSNNSNNVDWVVTGNDFTGGASWGLHYLGRPAEISGNDFTGSQYGLSLSNASWSAGNEFVMSFQGTTGGTNMNTFGNHAGQALSFYNVRYLNVSGWDMPSLYNDPSARRGLELNTVSYSLFENNNLSGMYNGIYTTGTGYETVIRNNNISNSNHFAWWSNNSNNIDWVVTGNDFTGGASWGLHYLGRPAEISGNDFTGSEYGLSLNNAHWSAGNEFVMSFQGTAGGTNMNTFGNHDGQAISFNNVRYINVSGWDMPSLYNDPSARRGLELNTVSYSLFENNNLSGMYNGVYTGGTGYENTVRNNNISNSSHFGWWSNNSNNVDWVVTGNDFTGGASWGLHYYGRAAEISGNDFTGSQYGLSLSNGHWSAGNEFVMSFQGTAGGTNMNTFGNHDGQAISFYNVRYINVSNWDMPSLYTDPSARRGLELNTVSYSLFENNNLSGMYNGVYTAGTGYENTVRNNNISNSSHYGWWSNNSNNVDWVVTGNDFTNGASWGLHYYGRAAEISGNDFTGSNYGLHLGNGHWSAGNEFVMSFQGTAGGTNMNTFGDHAGQAISFYNVRYINVSGWDMPSLYTNPSARRGLELNTVSYSLFENNNLSGMYNGVYTAGTGYENTVRNNNISNSNHYGWWSNNSNNIDWVVTGNNFTDGASWGLHYYGRAAEISGNDFTGSHSGLNLSNGHWSTGNEFVMSYQGTAGGTNMNTFGNHDGQAISFYNVRYINVSDWDMPSLYNDPSARRGFELNTVSYSLFENNNLSGMYNGVYVSGTNYDNTFNNNNASNSNHYGYWNNNGNDVGLTATSNDFSNSNGWAMAVGGRPDDISGNDFTGSNGGIYFRGSNGATLNFSSNTFDLPDAAQAIAIDYTNGFTLNGVLSIGNGGRAVSVTNSHNVIVDGLETCGKGDGVYISGGNGHIVRNSSFSEANHGVNVNNGTTVSLENNTFHNVTTEAAYNPTYSNVTITGSTTVNSADWCPVPPNATPVADAGADQNVETVDATADVTLDASASYDDDGQTLSYSWILNGSEVSTDASFTASLAPGTYTYTLTVSDGIDTATDDVIVGVVFVGPYEQTFTILGANGSVGDIDPYSQALPEGATTWQPAYLTGAHPWGYVPGTNSWVNFDPNDEVGLNTTTPYRIRFVVPDDFTDPSMVFQLKADNRAIVWINDTYVGQFDGQATYNVTDFVAEAALHAGLNEIRISLQDWGGIVGLNYRVDVTMTSAEDITDAVLTIDEATLLNNPPLADAGADQTITEALLTAAATLDASGSSDPDGNLLSYSWSENGSEIATGVNPTVNLAPGTHTITMTVSDGELTASDDVVIEVIGVDPPTFTPTMISGYTDILTNGGLVEANNLGRDAQPVTVGCYDFGNDQSGLSGWNLGSSADFCTDCEPGSAYDILLSSLVYQYGGTPTLTIDGLTPGNPYRVQLLMSNDANSTGNTATISVDGTPYTLAPWQNNTLNLVVDFTALSNSVVIAAEPNNLSEPLRAVINAYLLHDLSQPDMVCNVAPVADAGADQELTLQGANVNVTLNGSASSDPDGDNLTYTWEGPFGTATGANPTVSLGWGYHDITLTVSDGEESDSDEVRITVLSGLPSTEITRTVWEMNRGEGWSLLSAPLAYHGALPAYANASIPQSTDADWENTPDPNIIGFSETSIIPGNCLNAVDYTYFQTFVNIPVGATLTHFTVEFQGIDDGGRITIFNATYPTGLILEDSYVYLSDGYNPVISNLVNFVAEGENRVVVTQVDDCPSGNNLHVARIVLNGETVGVDNEAPVAIAGDDQNFDCVLTGVDVNLDGSASSDLDGDALSYTWTLNGSTVSTSAQFNTNLNVGTHVFTLTVSDGIDSSSDDVTVAVVADTEAPTLTLLGTGPFSVNIHDAYVEAGYEVSDVCDPNVTVAVAGSVDVDTPGAYTLTYTATDASGNATTAERIVTVVNSAPMAVAGDDQTIDCVVVETTFALDGSASSDADGDALTYSWILDGTEVSTSAAFSATLGAGTYTYTLTVSDGFESSSDDVTVTVIADTTPPELTLLGDNPLNLTRYQAFDEPGYEASDACNGDVTVAVDGAVDSNTPGVYTLTYTATDEAGNATVIERSVEVINAAPVAVAGEDQTIECVIDAAEFTLDASSSSDADGDALTYSWTLGGTEVSTSAAFSASLPAGDYAYTLTVSDGVDASSANVTVSLIADTTPPELTLLGDNPTSLFLYTPYDEAGYTAVDECDSDVSVTVSGTIDINMPGSYTLTYTAVDEAGNETIAERVVDVANNDPVVANAIDDITISFGDASLLAEVDLLTVFEDADVDDILTFAFTSDNSAPADVSLTDGILSMTAVDLGQTLIEVTATDPWGGTASNSFTLTINVNDDLSGALLFADNKIDIKKEVEVFSGNIFVNEAAQVHNNHGGNDDDDDDGDDDDDDDDDGHGNGHGHGNHHDDFQLKMDKDVYVSAGYMIKADRIEIKKDATVDSDIYYNFLDNRGDLTADLYDELELPLYQNLPPFKTGDAGNQNITVQKNQEVVLEPGDYGRIYVKDRGTVTFTGGVYNIRKLEAKKYSHVRFQERSEVRVEEKIKVSKQAYVGPAGGSFITGADIIFYAGGDDHDYVKLEEKVEFYGTIYTAEARVELKKEVNFTGAILASEIKVDKEAGLTLDSYFSSAAWGLAKGRNIAWVEPEMVAELPEFSELKGNYPNPFNPSTTIDFALSDAGDVMLKIYDIRGAEVATLMNGYQEAGHYSVQFTPDVLASGTYLYVLQSGEFREVKRMLYLK